MGEMRSLSFLVELVDRATAPLRNITSLGDLLDRRKVSLEVDTPGAEEAEDSFGRLTDNLDKLSEVGEKMGEGLSKAGEQLATAGAKMKEVWDPASQSFVKVAEAADQAGKKLETVTQKMGPLESAAKKVTSAIDEAKVKLAAIQVVATGFMFSSIQAAAGVERLENATKAAFGDGAEDILKWAEAGGKVVGVTDESRLAMAQLFKTAKMGNEEIMTTTELVEKYWKNKALRNKLQSAGIGSKEDLAAQIKNVEIGGGRAFGLKQVWGKEALDDVIQYGHGAKKVLSLMKKDLKNTADSGDDLLSVQADLAEVTGEFSQEAGKTLLPALTAVLKVLTGAIQMLQAIPGGPQIAALAAAFTFVAVSLVFFVGMLGQAYLGIQGLMKAQLLSTVITKASALATYGFAAAQSIATGAVGALTGALTVLKAAMLSNPITAAFVILLAVLILLETKFHIFSNLFKSLEKVDWAGKWAATIAYLSSLFDGIVEKVTWIKSLVSGGLGALGKIGGMGGIAVTMPGLGILVALFKTLLELDFGGIQKLKEIYDEVRGSFSKAIGHLGVVSSWLNVIFNFLTTMWTAAVAFYTWLKDTFVKAVNMVINGINSLLTGINALLAALHIDFQIPLLDLMKTKEEEEEEKGGTKIGGPSDAERHKKILEENLAAYNIEQAAGSQFGTPAVGAGSVPGYQPGFGGEFAGYNFESTRYPGLQRTGKELTEEQMLTGEWTPKNAVDEFGGFAGPLSQEQIDKFNQKIEAAKVAIDTQSVTVNAKSQEERVHEADKKAEAIKPKAGEMTQEYLDARAEVGKAAGLIDEDSKPIPTSSLTPDTWQWASKPEEEEPKESSSSSSESKPSSSPKPSSEPKGTPTGRTEGSTAIVSGGESGSGGMRAPDTFAAPATPPGFDSGGRVGETGRAIVHKGEEVVSEDDKTAYKIGVIPSILQGIDSITSKLRSVSLPDMREAAATPGATSSMAAATPPATVINEGSKTVNMYGPFVKVEKVDSRIDLDRMQNDLIKFLRGEIKSAMKG